MCRSGALHGIGTLLSAGDRYPANVSALARTALENSALVLYTNEVQDPFVRTARSVMVSVHGLKEIGAAKPDSPLNDLFKKQEGIRQRFASQGVGTKHKLPKYTDLVSRYFEGFMGREMYEEFSRSVHFNVAQQALLGATQDFDNRTNVVRTYEVGIRTALAVGTAAHSMEQYRKLNGIDTQPIQIMGVLFAKWAQYVDSRSAMS